MTKLYFFNPETREFIYGREAEVIPGLCVESPEQFPNCTGKPLPENIPDGFAAVLGEGADADWALVEDHRGEAYRKADGVAVRVNDLGPLPAELVSVKPDADLQRWNDEAGAWEVDPDQLRAVKLTEVEARYGEHLAAGFGYGGKVLQADDGSQAKINGAVTRALLAAQSGEAFSVDWTCADNSVLTLDGAGMCAMGAACGDFVTQAFYRRRALKDALLAAATVAEIEAIQIDSDWP